MEHLLALDQGSGSSKAALISRAGRIVRSAFVPIRTYRHPDSRVEHRPEEILSSSLAAIRSVLGHTRSKAIPIAAVGIAGQRSTVVLWDKVDGTPLCPAVSWQDLRASGDAGRFLGLRNTIREKTGLFLSAYYSALKIRWILKNIRGARRRAESGRLICGSVNSYLLWHLSRGELHVVDPTQAARFLLLNLKTLRWDAGLLADFGIPPAMLPGIVPTISKLGEVRVAGRSLAVHATVGDQQAALLGLGGNREGCAVINYGTGGFVVLNTGPRMLPVPGLLTGLAWNDGRSKTFEIEGPVNAVGSVLEWMRRIGLGRTWSEIARLSEKGTGEVTVIPSLAGLGAPHWRESVGMSLEDIGPGTSRSDLALGVLEGIAFRVREILECIERRPKALKGNISVGGGVSRMDRLMQIQSDVLGRPLFRPAGSEATLAGAGWMAGIGLGWWATAREIPGPVKGKWFRPEKRLESRYRRWKDRLRARLEADTKEAGSEDSRRSIRRARSSSRLGGG